MLRTRDLRLIIARTGDARGPDLLLVWVILGWNTKNGVYAKLVQFDHRIAGEQPRAPEIHSVHLERPPGRASTRTAEDYGEFFKPQQMYLVAQVDGNKTDGNLKLGRCEHAPSSSGTGKSYGKNVLTHISK